MLLGNNLKITFVRSIYVLWTSEEYATSKEGTKSLETGWKKIKRETGGVFIKPCLEVFIYGGTEEIIVLTSTFVT